MKKLYFLIIACLMLQNSYGQKLKFTDPANEWTERWAIPLAMPHIEHHQIAGTDVSGGYTYYKLHNGLVREDSIQQKIYWKYAATDTVEYLLYDYTLKTGDTIQFTAGPVGTQGHQDSFLNVVLKVDSVLINSTWHKMWFFAEAKGISKGGRYIVVEGIGCLTGLLWPLYPYSFEGTNELICFKNNGNMVTVPSGSFMPYLGAETCALSVGEANNKETSISIIPNPANETAIIQLPYNMHSGTLAVVNALGQTVQQKEIADKTEVPIGDLRLSGIYFYRVTDKETNQTFNDKFIYQ